MKKNIRAILRRRFAVMGDVQNPQKIVLKHDGNHPVLPVPDLIRPAGGMSHDGIARCEYFIMANTVRGKSNPFCTAERKNDPRNRVTVRAKRRKRSRFPETNPLQFDFLRFTQILQHLFPADQHIFSPVSDILQHFSEKSSILLKNYHQTSVFYHCRTDGFVV